MAWAAPPAAQARSADGRPDEVSHADGRHWVWGTGLPSHRPCKLHSSSGEIDKIQHDVA